MYSLSIFNYLTQKIFLIMKIKVAFFKCLTH